MISLATLRGRFCRLLGYILCSLAIVSFCIFQRTWYSSSYVAYLASVDWSSFAYVQYATNDEYLCNSIMMFESLRRLNVKAELLLLYPASDDETLDGRVSDRKYRKRLLEKAKDRFGVRLKPIELLTQREGDMTWRDSHTKLLTFNQTEYRRVVHLDSDAVALKSMDELFLLPPTPLVLPKAYWMDPDDPVKLTPVVLVAQPSASEFAKVEEAIGQPNAGFDMEIINRLYINNSWVLPHQKYAVLSREFRSSNHSGFFENDHAWDPEEVLKKASYVHFSEWPIPKPWLKPTPTVVQDLAPKCVTTTSGDDKEDCRTRDLWYGLFRDYLQRRKVIPTVGDKGTN